jgi:DNA integrity scanning protein DisA with diadenylate cyclase activity
MQDTLDDTKVQDPAKERTVRPLSSSKDIHIVVMEGDLDRVLGTLRSGKGAPVHIIERGLDILIGLSLKGYEGKPIGAIYLIGDVEGVKRNSSQMIINPFKGWNKVNIMDPEQQPTFEAFTQLDGAILIDTRGFARSAGIMIHVKNQDPDHFGIVQGPLSVKGRGTRWRASKFITSVTGTTALTLSHSGDIAIFQRGKEIGRLQRKIRRIPFEKASAVFGHNC